MDITQILYNIVETTFNSFDFTYCVIVNILTYVLIKTLDELNKEKQVTVLAKRAILLFSIVLIAALYILFGEDGRTILNSAILAPVAWSWIFKPIIKKIGIDYKKL
jgi:hypothetical protein